MALGKEEDEDKGPAGLIDLDMGAFGSGSMSDPLRHAVGMRTAQDQRKMRMWNSFSPLFQNTIFHGEQDPEIKALRHGGTIQARLARGRQYKEAGNEALKATSAGSKSSAEVDRAAAAQGQSADEAQQQRVREIEDMVVRKEQELKALREELQAARSSLEQMRSMRNASAPVRPREEDDQKLRDGLEKAVTSYEKAAGLFRYVECTQPDWKNDDGSYKGIEDQHLSVDASVLEGEGAEVAEARELVASCYLNVALACQKMKDFERMRRACDEVLAHVAPASIKALYRRAQARIGPASAVDADRDAAIQDLHQAAQLAPQDKEVRGLLAKLRAEWKAQEVSDRSTFAGLFDRGEVVANDPRTEGEKPTPQEWDLRDPKVQAYLDVRPGPQHF